MLVGGLAETSSAIVKTPVGGMLVGGLAEVNSAEAFVPTGGVLAGGEVDTAFTEFGSGGTLAGGLAAVSSAEAKVTSGGILVGGTADEDFADVIEPIGGILVGGIALQSEEQIEPVSGGILVNGLAEVASAEAKIPVGGVLGGGETQITHNEIGSGGMLAGGESKPGFGYCMSGGVTVHDGLWGHYPFDEGTGSTAGDVSGFDYDGSLINMEPGDWIVGNIGSGALDFNSDDTDDRIDLPLEVLNAADNVTVSFWMKTTKTGPQAVVSGANSTNDDEFLIFFNSDTQLTLYNNTSVV
jgi:hypothetical protein